MFIVLIFFVNSIFYIKNAAHAFFVCFMLLAVLCHQRHHEQRARKRKNGKKRQKGPIYVNRKGKIYIDLTEFCASKILLKTVFTCLKLLIDQKLGRI